MADKTEKKAGKSEKKPGFMAKVKGFFGRIGEFFRNTKSELKKVVWPSKKDIKNNSLVVLAVVAITVVALIVLDTAFGGIMRLIIGA